MQRWTRNGKSFPVMNGGLKELYEILTSDDHLDNLEYIGGRLKVEYKVNKDIESVILWNPQYIAKFKVCDMLCGDGTFSRFPAIAPKIDTKHHQLYVINAIYKSSILMNHKSEAAYDSVFEVIFKDFETFNKDIMADFEIASRNSFKRVMPLADIRGCYFHHVQFTEIDGIRFDPEQYASVLMAGTMQARAGRVMNVVWTREQMKKLYLSQAKVQGEFSQVTQQEISKIKRLCKYLQKKNPISLTSRDDIDKCIKKWISDKLREVKRGPRNQRRSQD
ncbi:hypothetical protein KQX54_002862 [Cotesia glomerata]|uniref:MULE transposase domain-containing protein n=1 Tax=Cotesia glomerata TaxID=32391 RepID=A0AAV7I005_COTGL|nr:hypothetical protein KQX54_002862 [Cotesia glomerata]